MWALLLCSRAYSQKAVLNNSDTSICFTIDQARFILKQINHLEYLDTLCKLQKEEIDLWKRNSIDLEKIVMEKQYQIRLKEDAVELKQLSLDRQIEINNAQKKLIRKEKFQKNVAIICGSVATGIMTYLFITK